MNTTDAAGQLQPLALLSTLVCADIEFVVIGGFALLAHGAMRATKDIDVVPDSSADNLDRLWTVLDELGASPQQHLADFEENEMPLPWSRAALDGGGNWILETRLGRLDLMQFAAGVEGYPHLRANAVDVDIDDVGRVWFAGRDDLIAMKLAAGRPQDLVDVQSLRQRRAP